MLIGSRIISGSHFFNSLPYFEHPILQVRFICAIKGDCMLQKVARGCQFMTHSAVLKYDTWARYHLFHFDKAWECEETFHFWELNALQEFCVISYIPELLIIWNKKPKGQDIELWTHSWGNLKKKMWESQILHKK